MARRVRFRFILGIFLTALANGAWSEVTSPVAYVRIGQLGYEVGRSARAYLVSSINEAGAVYAVNDRSGHAAFSGSLGKPAEKWGAFFVTPMDFTVSRAGNYVIAVEGPIPARSRPFVIGPPAALYSRALSNSLSFYETERDGPDFVRNALRTAPGHLNDARATVYATPALNADDLVTGPLVATGETIDASGGWWDAGDYMKYVETTSYAVGVMLTGLRDFPCQMGPGGPVDFTREAKFGLKWLARMWNDKTRTLYYEVGLSQDFVNAPTLSDYDLWRLPQVDDTLGGGAPDYIYINHRPVFAAGPAGSLISPNLAGRLTADFALCAVVFRRSDAALARACLGWAEHVFDLADTHPRSLLTIVPYDGYPETEWRDDMEWGATELAIALTVAGGAAPADLPHPRAGYYLSQAAHWANAYITGPDDGADTLNLYDVSGLAHFDLHRAINLAGRPFGLEISQAELVTDLRNQLALGTKRAAIDPFGYGADWTQSDSAAYGIGLSVTADEVNSLGGETAWDGYARRWMANVAGANIWGVSMIILDDATVPHCPHHQAANIVGSLTGSGIVLKGAVVEGPIAPADVATGMVDGMRACPADGSDVYKTFTGRGSRFWDNVQNYANTEPALDLTALSPLMYAWRMAGSPQDLAALR